MDDTPTDDEKQGAPFSITLYSDRPVLTFGRDDPASRLFTVFDLSYEKAQYLAEWLNELWAEREQ